MPGTLTPTLGVVSAPILVSQLLQCWETRTHTVTDNHGVDEKSKKGVLVLSRVFLQQSCRVVVADWGVGRPLCRGSTQCQSKCESSIMHFLFGCMT